MHTNKQLKQQTDNLELILKLKNDPKYKKMKVELQIE